MESIYPLDLRSSKVTDILTQLPDDVAFLNVFPNLPGIKMMISNYIIQENHFWIITDNLPISIYTKLEDKGLVPYHETYEELIKTYYNS